MTGIGFNINSAVLATWQTLNLEQLVSYLKKRKSAFVYAFSGLSQAIAREPHMKIHSAATLLVCLAGAYFSITGIEWILITGCIVLVICLEIINTAIENTCNLITKEYNLQIKYIKDISAAAVLLGCLLAVITGVIIFTPYLKHFFERF